MTKRKRPLRIRDQAHYNSLIEAGVIPFDPPFKILDVPVDSIDQLNQDVLGIAWWHSLTENQRTHWLTLAGSARPVDAWRRFKASQLKPDQ